MRQNAAFQVGTKRGFGIGRNTIGDVFSLMASNETGFQVVEYGLVQNGSDGGGRSSRRVSVLEAVM